MRVSEGKTGAAGGAFPLMTIVFGYSRGARPVMPPKLPPEQIFFEGRYKQPDPGVMRTGYPDGRRL